MNTPTVCVADDHGLFREGLIALLARDGRLAVVAEAATGVEAVREVERIRSDFLFLDVDMPGSPAPATIAAVTRVSPRTRIVVLTMHDDDILRSALLEAGASAYATKTTPVRELVDIALNTAQEGQRENRVATGAPDTPVTAREAQILRLVAHARTNREIASELAIAEGTVKRHLSNIFEKLGATSRLDAVHKARRLGLPIDT